MPKVLTPRRLLVLLVLGIVAFAFWPSLFGGGSLVSVDIVETAAPFDSYQPDDFSLENGPGDPINIHAHWASLAADVRSGDAGWWNPDLAAGQPTMKGGLPVFDLPYLVVPDWYAPGLVAALRVLVAIGLTFGLLRSLDLARTSALVGGIAFGFSGFMVGWMNWPHSSVAALAPGLLWAIERAIRDPRPWRAAPLGSVVALMVWANFPSVTVFLLLGASAYALIRLAAEPRRDEPGGPRIVALGTVALLAAVLAVFLAAPHLIGFGEYLDWADTTHRVNTADDSSAGVAYLMTAVAPAVWGSDAVGAPWFGEGNWVEFNAHVGASVFLLGVLGLTGWRRGDRRRRSVTLAVGVLVALGVLIAYVGGPLGIAIGDVGGAQSGLATRAKVLWSLGMAMAAALGVEQLRREHDGVGSLVRNTLIVLGGIVVVMLPSLRNWLDAARSLGVFRETLAVSTLPILAAAATAGLIVARMRDRMSGRLVGWALVGVVTIEVLAFAMPVPTTVSASERLRATPAHDEVSVLLQPGERLAGEGRTFFPSTTQLFDIEDARGQLLKSPGYQALLKEIDADMLTRSGGGTPTYPNIAEGTDPRSPVWSAMGVGLWAQFPDSVPIGTLRPPTDVATSISPSSEELRGSTTVPAGGLRSVILEVVPSAGGFVDVEITTSDGATNTRRWVEPRDVGFLSVAVLGEHLPIDSTVDVVVAAPEDTLRVAVNSAGALSIGTVAGDDDLELVRVGDIILFDRRVAPVAVVEEWTTEANPDRAAALVAEGLTTVDRPLGNGGGPAGSASEVTEVRYGTDEITVALDGGDGGLLVVSQSHYPGWTATVDGASAEVVVANAAFIGVAVPSGADTVVLRFRPEHLDASLMSVLVGVLLVFGLLAHGRYRGDLRLVPLRRG